MTDVLIKRELLERLETWVTDDCEALRELQAILAAPRQPEGEGLEVVAWLGGNGFHTEEKEATGAPFPLIHLSDAQRAIAELREECERLRGECARLESKYERDVWGLNNEGDPIGGDHPSGFANDLLRVTIERDTLRQQLAELRDMLSGEVETNIPLRQKAFDLTEQRDKLAGLLREAHSAGRSRRLTVDELYRIDAALAEVKP